MIMENSKWENDEKILEYLDGELSGTELEEFEKEKSNIENHLFQ